MQNLETIIRRLTVGIIFGTAVTLTLPLQAQDGKVPEPKTEKKQEATDETDEEESDKKEKSDANGDKDSDKKKKEKKKKFIKDLVKDHSVFSGIFTLYQDPKNGSLMMEIHEDQLGQEFIYTAQTANGVIEGGHFRGQYRSQKIIKISKHFDKIEISEENPHFYFDPESSLARAKDANISNASLFIQKIRAKSEDEKRFLIPVDTLFRSETLLQVKPTGNPRLKPWESFRLGKLSQSKSRITSVKNYPENMDITVDYVYSNPSPLHRGSWFDITDARNVKVSMRHTFLNMPDNNYRPRFDDPRVGYFLDYVNDMTSETSTPWRDMINRWHLVKKDANAPLSEPEKPIIWWIENTTPKNIRPTIKKAVESWNAAFEQAGFKNAIQVKVQPDDAEWDAGDIRYNVLRWTSSPIPVFGGYGPSFTNPRTGEILGADIMLEYSFLTHHLRTSNMFETAGLTLESPQSSVQGFIASLKEHERQCGMATYLQMSNMLGQTFATAMDADVEVSHKLLEESIYYLMLHEVGHTLGLNHNMKGTYARSYATAHSLEAQSDGLAGSVMDYPSVNYAPLGESQAHFYTVRPGAYDIWAIQFGYDPAMSDTAKRQKHLARSTEKALAFGNDADDMRAPGRGIDPRVNIFDMSDDPVRYAEDRLKLDRSVLGKLKDKYTNDGKGYQELRNAYIIVTADMAWQGRVASRYIGGVYVDRAVAGQSEAGAPYRPVQKAKQRQAMDMLREYIFSPNAFSIDPELAQHLAIQRRGFFHGSFTEDPKIHSRAKAIQADILAHLMHPRTLARITDTGLYGNDYNVTEMMADLTDAIFEDDSRGAVNTFRQELQIYYVRGLIGMLKDNAYDFVSRSNAHNNLRRLGKDMARWRGDAATRAHREHVRFLIDKALEVYEG